MKHNKYKLLLIVLLLSALHINAQPKQLNIGSAFWYKYNMANQAKMSVPDLTKVISGFHWRLWYNGQTTSYAISLDRSVDSVYSANILIFTQEYVDLSKEKPTNRMFIQTHQLNEKQAFKMATLLNTQHISQISTDSLIKGWGDAGGLDGVTYNIEEATSNAYSFKSYWTPSAVNVKEAKLMQAFVDSIEIITDSKVLTSSFTKQVPFAAYSTGGPMIAVKILTKKQQVKLRKERDAYRRGQGPTIQ